MVCFLTEGGVDLSDPVGNYGFNSAAITRSWYLTPATDFSETIVGGSGTPDTDYMSLIIRTSANFRITIIN